VSNLQIKKLSRDGLGPMSLTIGPGECVCLSGESGAGKTLLLRAVADLDPHQGEVSLDGQPCSAMSAPRWRRQVGLLLAESQWWYDTVGEHFQGLDTDCLQRLGFKPEVMAWQVSRLSTGERQRLALLRLFCQRPIALLLDEPTASLDPENVGRVERFVSDERRARKTPVLWVSHDPRQMRRVADRHFRIVEGKLVEAAL